MNIFVLSRNPYEIATHMHNLHVNKMLTETRQLLVLADVKCARRGYFHHPCAKWVRESDANYNWLLAHGLSIYSEWVKRKQKSHKSGEWLNQLSFRETNDTMTEWPQVMPEEFRCDDTVQAYRKYYAFKLRDFKRRGYKFK